MLRFGTDYYPPNRWGKEEEQKEWLQLLRDTMRDLNGRAFIAESMRTAREAIVHPINLSMITFRSTRTTRFRCTCTRRRCTNASLTFA
jgi:hypothetical protein